MCNILVFGGTTEGRLLAEFCTQNEISSYVSVTTEYGADLLPNSEFIYFLIGKMTCEEMTDFIIKNKIELVMDATHPYAVEATQNIKNACKNAAVRYFRVMRETEALSKYGTYFDNIDLMIQYLNQSNGGILVTTGSKELQSFCRINNYRERCAVRVLPSEKIIDECTALGFAKERIIAEKGPFSANQNVEHIKKFNVRYLVTKESGTIGGFDSKVTAAEQCGAELLIIRRPTENGISLKNAKKIILTEKFNE